MGMASVSVSAVSAVARTVRRGSLSDHRTLLMVGGQRWRQQRLMVLSVSRRRRKRITSSSPSPSSSLLVFRSAGSISSSSSSSSTPFCSDTNIIRRATTDARRAFSSNNDNSNNNNNNNNNNKKGSDDGDDDPFGSAVARHLKHNNSSNSNSSNNDGIILPSVQGLDEWRQLQKEEQPLDRLRNNNNDNTAALPYYPDDLRQLYNPELHLPSAPQDWTGFEASTPVFEEIAARIGVTGRPLSAAEYMRAALQHSQHGYYTRAQSRRRNSQGEDEEDDDFDDFDDDDYDKEEEDQDDSKATKDNKNKNSIIGGDFVTAPEVSQVFGECLGVWFATQYSALNAAANSSSNDNDSNNSRNNDSNSDNTARDWQWLECGPGTGKLMTDLLRFTRDLSRDRTNTGATNHMAGFGRGCRRVHFVETSPALRQRQRDALVQSALRHDFSFEFCGFDDDNDENNDDKTIKDPNIIEVSETITTKTTASPPADSSTHKKKRTIAVHWHRSLEDFRMWQQQQQQQNKAEPPLMTFAVAQEFIDALPVYAFEKTADNKGVWRERLVDVALRADVEQDLLEEEAEKKKQKQQQSETTTTTADASSSSASTSKIDPKKKKPRLRIVLAPEATPPLRTLLGTNEEGRLLLPPGTEDTAPAGSIVEVCPEGILAAQDLASIVAAHGGAALLIDYGSAEGSRDSLRGYSRHREEHFLSRPGLIDITADVDFAALRHAVNHRPQQQQPKQQQQQSVNNGGGAVDNNKNNNAAQQPATASAGWTARAHGPVTQGEFLMSMGIQERIVSMIEKPHVSDDEAERLVLAMERLVSHDSQHMGERYKVLAITARRPKNSSTTSSKDDDDDDSPPPGFEHVNYQ